MSSGSSASIGVDARRIAAALILPGVLALAGCGPDYESAAVASDEYTIEIVATQISKVDGIAVGPSGAIYATQEFSGGGVIVIDPESGSFRYVVRDLSRPDNIVVLDDGVIFVTEEVRSGRLVRIGPRGRVETFADGLYKPEGLDLGPDGMLYLVEHAPDARLLRYQLDGRQTTLYSGIRDGEGLRVIADGSVVIAETTANRLIRVFPDGESVTIAEGEIFKPDGVAYDWANDRLFVTEDLAPGRMLEVDYETGALVEIVTELNKPQTMAFEEDGSILLAEQGEKRILRLRQVTSP